MVTVSFHYWAGARAAAGVEMETVEAGSVGEAVLGIRTKHRDGRFDRMLDVSSLLADGQLVRGAALSRPLTESTRVEVLPPFAGGSVAKISSQNVSARLIQRDNR